jgi:hypothetical protein
MKALFHGVRKLTMVLPLMIYEVYEQTQCNNPRRYVHFIGAQTD